MNVFKATEQNSKKFFKDLPSANPKFFSTTEWIVRSLLFVVLVFFILVTIQWAAGVFNYWVLNKSLYVDFHGYNAVGKVFLSNNNVLYWFSGWGRQNMFGVMWFAIWSGIVFTFIWLVFSNFGPAFLAGMFFIWFFLWTMCAYPAVLFTRASKSEAHYWTSIGLLMVFIVGLLFTWIPLLGGIILIGDILGFIVNLATGAVKLRDVGLFIWMIVAAVLAIVAIVAAIMNIAAAFESPLWNHDNSSNGRSNKNSLALRTN